MGLQILKKVEVAVRLCSKFREFARSSFSSTSDVSTKTIPDGQENYGRGPSPPQSTERSAEITDNAKVSKFPLKPTIIDFKPQMAIELKPAVVEFKPATVQLVPLQVASATRLPMPGGTPIIPLPLSVIRPDFSRRPQPNYTVLSQRPDFLDHLANRNNLSTYMSCNYGLDSAVNDAADDHMIDEASEGLQRSSFNDSHKTPNVYINGLPPHFPEDQLYALAAPFGEVKSVRTFTRHVRDSESGYGFVLSVFFWFGRFEW